MFIECLLCAKISTDIHRLSIFLVQLVRRAVFCTDHHSVLGTQALTPGQAQFRRDFLNQKS